jgi:XRE family transcriptional regulator, regulator of sulfur utilization
MASEPNVGQRIRSIREQQGLSLRALAERAGLSINAISLIERGENSPTVSSLHLLARALEVSVSTFFEDEHEQVVVLTPAGGRLRSQGHGITMESLGIGLSQQQMEPFLVTLEPGAGNIEQPITHGGEEFVYCLAGEVEYSVKSELYRLQAGDSLLFQAGEPHCFHNPGQQPAQFIVVFGADRGSQPARRLHLQPHSEAASS